MILALPRPHERKNIVGFCDAYGESPRLMPSEQSRLKLSYCVVVASRHREELSTLNDTEHIYFAGRPHAWDILEAVEHYDFLNL